tara:strand:- start:796 stop:1572 length:777 start_codon:yes stop_codon:yes gene_type:complete
MSAKIHIQINYLITQLSNKVIIYICKLFPFFCPKALNIKDLYQLKNEGYVKLPRFIKESDIAICQKSILNILDDINFDIKINGELKKGNIKINSLQKFSKYLNKMRQQYFYIFMSFFFYGYLKMPNIIFTYTSDGTIKNRYVTGKCKKQIAGDPHFDNYKNYLKIMILLGDVDVNNGPTSFVQRSAANKKMQDSYIKNCENKKGKKVVDKILLRKICISNNVVQLTGKKGDAYLINTKNVHWAENLIYGNREILWLYF